MFATLQNREDLRDHCGVCDYRAYCGGCRARALAYTGDIQAGDPGCVYNYHEWDELVASHGTSTGLQAESWRGVGPSPAATAVASQLVQIVGSGAAAAAAKAGDFGASSETEVRDLDTLASRLKSVSWEVLGLPFAGLKPLEAKTPMSQRERDPSKPVWRSQVPGDGNSLQTALPCSDNIEVPITRQARREPGQANLIAFRLANPHVTGPEHLQEIELAGMRIDAAVERSQRSAGRKGGEEVRADRSAAANEAARSRRAL